MKKHESILKRDMFTSKVGDLLVVGEVITEDGKLVGDSEIVMSDDGGNNIAMKLWDAKAMLTELTEMVDEMSGLVQRTTTVKEHDRPGYTVAEHERKIPLGRKDMANGHGAGTPKCSVEPPDDELTKAGLPRQRRRNFTESEVKEIRELGQNGCSGKEISEVYGCHPTTINKILRGDSYPSISP